MKRLRIPFTIQTSWKVLSTAAVLMFVIGTLLFNRLDILLPGYSAAEVTTAERSSTIQTIIDNPVNAPYKLAVYGVTKVSDNPLLSTRLVSGFIGILTIGLFYVGVRQWHSNRVAFLATVLFASSAWFLYTARSGTPDIMLPFTVLLFAVAGYWLASAGHSRLSYILVILSLGISVYVPGALWVILLALLIRRTKDFKTVTNELAWWQIVLLGIALVMLIVAPLAYAAYLKPVSLLAVLGVPDMLPQWLEFLKALVFVPLSLLFVSGAETEYWIGRLPLLDIFSSVLLVMGVYYYTKYRSLDRAKMIIGFFIVAGVLVALNGPITMASLLPVTYVLVAGGIALLLSQWNTVFPRNPLAQSFAILLVTLAVCTSVIFNLRAYFIAWPSTDRTEATYNQQETNLLQ